MTSNNCLMCFAVRCVNVLQPQKKRTGEMIIEMTDVLLLSPVIEYLLFV